MFIHEVASQSVDNWNVAFKRRLYDYEVREATVLMDLLENFKFADGEEDSRNWKWSKKGEFSVRSMYNASLIFLDVGKVDKRIWSTLWPARVSFFMWTVSKRKLLTQDMLKHRGQIIAKLVWKMIPAAIMWTVWKERNRRIFEEKDQCWSRVLNSVKVLIYSCGKLHDDFKGVTLDYLMGHWKEFIFDPP
ncbi:Reverse transcriptase zinc-binding domain [Macleaya cordata]|uniref:Reverse transcriptase zinc-binding domain n=1 Tax=Macleaya cordata TaxID=56857 RepID=A0A200QZK5_MACCD|nr:Reverse transcriptase zinc-binding domain [Macleaya cordata]